MPAATARSRLHASSPKEAASFTRSGLVSMPMTRHPAAAAICAAMMPSRPSPMTATLSPMLGFSQPETVQGDCAQGGEGRRLEVHRVRAGG